MKIATRPGHNKLAPGARWFVDEVDEDRKIFADATKYLRTRHSIVDCTPPDNPDKDAELLYGINMANNCYPDLFFSIHLNKAYEHDVAAAIGTEIWIWDRNSGAIPYANSILSKFESLGFVNRGIKYCVEQGRSLGECRAITAPSMIIECFFMESVADVALYNSLGVNEIAYAIASGIDPNIVKEVPSMNLPSDFNEQFYLYANPDIRQVVPSVFSTGAAHYTEYGYADNPPRIYKPTLPLDFNEFNYYDINPDILQAVQAGIIESGAWHWLVQGWMENMMNASDRRYKYNNDPPVFYPTNPTPKTAILSTQTATCGQAKEWAKSIRVNNVAPSQEFINLADLYWQIAPIAGVDPVVAYAQFAHETGYGYLVPSSAGLDMSYHNPCGLKIPQGGGDYDASAHKVFASWAEGITAHIDHLALYAGASGYPKSNTPDPRHFSYLLGTAPFVEDLSGKWAPSATYHTKLIAFMNGIKAASEPPSRNYKDEIRQHLTAIENILNEM